MFTSRGKKFHIDRFNTSGYWNMYLEGGKVYPITRGYHVALLVRGDPDPDPRYQAEEDELYGPFEPWPPIWRNREEDWLEPSYSRSSWDERLYEWPPVKEDDDSSDQSSDDEESQQTQTPVPRTNAQQRANAAVSYPAQGNNRTNATYQRPPPGNSGLHRITVQALTQQTAAPRPNPPAAIHNAAFPHPSAPQRNATPPSSSSSASYSSSSSWFSSSSSSPPPTHPPSPLSIATTVYTEFYLTLTKRGYTGRVRNELLERYTARVGRRLDVETMRGIAARVRKRAARGARKRGRRVRVVVRVRGLVGGI